MSADHQQERLETVGWIVGFVDGEGTFSISVFRNVTRNLNDLVRIIVPFFHQHTLVVKKRDFELFSEAIEMIRAGRHRTEARLAQLAKISEQMNRKQPSRFLESSQTIRQTPPLVEKI